jgi:hypothetical protein
MHCWPDLAAQLVDHDIGCDWRQTMPKDGAGVYVHFMER